MVLGITGKAARAIIDLTHPHIVELEEDLVPAITWIVGDTDLQSAVPRLAIGIAERKQVEGRFLRCNEFDCQIGQVLPDEILQKYQSFQIDLKDEKLVFVENSK